MQFGCFFPIHIAILPQSNICFKYPLHRNHALAKCLPQNACCLLTDKCKMIFLKNSVTISPSGHKINHKQHLEGTNMSDLTATHCGCNNTNTANNGCGCGSWIWILILLSCCGNNGDGCGCGNGFFGNGFFGGNDNNCCSWIWILILLSCCCNN